MHPRWSTSRRTFPLTRHFHPDHRDPDDLVALTVRRLFCLPLFLYIREAFPVASENPAFPSRTARLLASGLGRRGSENGAREIEGREHRDREAASGRERGRETRPRKQVPGQIGRPTADRPAGGPQVTHPDSTNNQTPAQAPAVWPVRLASLLFLAILSCAPRRLKDSDGRGQAESLARMAPKGQGGRIDAL